MAGELLPEQVHDEEGHGGGGDEKGGGQHQGSGNKVYRVHMITEQRTSQSLEKIERS